MRCHVRSNLGGNSISVIPTGAFSGQPVLTNLDLSYNTLTLIQTAAFSANTMLTSLYVYTPIDVKSSLLRVLANNPIITVAYDSFKNTLLTIIGM